MCAFAVVFLFTLPLTGIPDETLVLRLAGFAVAGAAAGWLSASPAAPLLGLLAGHVVMFIDPGTAPKSISISAYAAAAVGLLWTGMAVARAVHPRLLPARALGKPAAPPPLLVLVSALAAGLFPFAFSPPGAPGLETAVPVGFAAAVLLGVLSPRNAARPLAWFIIGHWPYLTLAFFWFVIPAFIDVALAWIGIWLGSELANGAGAPAPAHTPNPAPVARSRDPGRRMG